jgi:8-oxo-dGTP pyrophosphatase MutT (NUDIX family)
MVCIHAVLDRDLPANLTQPAMGTDRGGRLIARYPVELGGDDIRSVSFVQSEHRQSGASASGDPVPLEDVCVAQLLADAVSQLAATAENADPTDEPELVAPHGGKRSAGIILIDERGWLTIREPAGHFAGYQHSYAKGRIDPGETPRETARRELTEETGLTGRIVGVIGDFEGQTGVTRFYVGVRSGGEVKLSAETQAIKTVSPFTAMDLLNVQRDKDVLVRLVEVAAGIVEWPWTIDGQVMQCRLIDARVVCTTHAPR